MNSETILSELTTEEKAAIVSGTDFMYTNEIPRLSIPALCMADGPHGLRKQTGKQDNGIAQSEPATAFPTAVTTASSWNPENTRRMGAAIGEECRHYAVHLLLGPGANIKRNPLCGRNFEYFSEDPLLSGTMGAAEVQGVQSRGVGVSVKHFALNNSENYRFMGDSIVDERAMREIYLRSFERIVRESHPATMMCAYNRINGTYCSENRWLLTDVLRKEWGFDGAVMTDWGAVHERVPGLKAGLDLEMPGDTAICRRWILDAVADGTLPMAVLDQAVLNVLKLVDTCVTGEKAPEADFDAHHALAADIAADSAVLLKNDGSLPLTGTEKLLVVGDLFEKMRYQGAGSSMICPARLTTPKTAFDQKGICYTWCRGYAENRAEPQPELVREAVKKAEAANTILVFAGLTDYVESEGADRENMRLPENQLALIDGLCGTGKTVIVVLFGGGVVELPFADRVSAILHMFLPGQNGGTAAAKLLYGDACPGGRLAETWPETCADVPFGSAFGQTTQEIYKESVYVGYRFYLTAGKQVRYPFGYGLSYTAFEWENMRLTQTEEAISVTCDVTNTGSCPGAEVVQLYVSAPKTGVFKPERELRGFRKVFLDPGETKTVTITVPVTDLRYYNAKEHRWVLEGGRYTFRLCSDCQTVRLAQPLEIEGEPIPSPYPPEVLTAYETADIAGMTEAAFEAMSGLKLPALPPRFPVTLESRFTDLRQTSMGRILFGSVLSVANRQMKRALRLPEGPERDNKIKGAQFLRRILESNSIRSMSMSSGKSLPYNLANAFMEMTNGHMLRGIKCICTPIRVPVLPKDQKEEK
ncbi:MAG: glycoside hydrolase family 3 C-terminal domain-containing protein [Oscillospiraceae bacterium]|nr:glycoside hydrolase family 3 C-terminal domain-containing protein [Oscillospiraceae bacterium]